MPKDKAGYFRRQWVTHQHRNANRAQLPIQAGLRSDSCVSPSIRAGSSKSESQWFHLIFTQKQSSIYRPRENMEIITAKIEAQRWIRSGTVFKREEDSRTTKEPSFLPLLSCAFICTECWLEDKSLTEWSHSFLWPAAWVRASGPPTSRHPPPEGLQPGPEMNENWELLQAHHDVRLIPKQTHNYH